MGLPPSSRHNLKSLRVVRLNLRSDAWAEAKTIKEQARGIAPVEHEAGQPAEGRELLGHIPPRSPRPDRFEKLVGLDRLQPAMGSPVRKVGIVGFLADREHASQDEHNLGRVERCREGTELDATSRAKLAEVDESVLANLHIEALVLLGVFDDRVLLAGRNQRTPAGAIPPLGVLSVEDRRQAVAEASNFFTPVENIGGRAGTAGGASVNRDVDTAMRLATHADRTLGSDALEEGEEVEDVLKASIALENRRDKLALVVVAEGADRRIAVSFPRLAVEGRGLDSLAIGEGHLPNRKATAVTANVDAEIGGNLSFDLDSEGCCFVYHGSIMPHPNPLGKYFFST